MPWNGSGIFTRGNGSNSGAETWQDDVSVGIKIRADRHDVHDQDISDGIDACITQNNESKPTAHFLPNATASLDLGASTTLWREVFTQSVTIGEGSAVAQYATLADLVADVDNVTIGKLYYIEERTTGNGGGAYWKAVDATTVTVNGFDTVTGDATISFQLHKVSIPFINYELDISQLGYGGGTVSDSSMLQYAMDSDHDLYIPPLEYRCVDVTLTKGKAIRWAEGATFKPIGTGSFVFKIDGSGETIDGETGLAVKINRIAVDGGARAFAIDGVMIDNVTRSELPNIEVKNLDGTALSAHSFRETRIGNLRTRDCGSWTNATTYKAVIDFDETILTGDANNNLFINNWYSIYSRGPDLVVDSASGRTSNPRKIHFNNIMVHGHIEASDPAGNPLTTAEKTDRIQVILGTCEEVTFGSGSIQFAATAANPIHVTTGSNGSAGKIDFGNIRVHSRYDFASTLSNADGINLDSGDIHMEGVSMGNGYTGFDAINAATGVNLYINPFNNTIDTGAVTITDTETVYVRGMDIDFQSNDILNVRTIKTGAASLEFREGQSGSNRKAFELKNSTNAAMGKVIATTFIEQGNITLPTAANMILDGIPAALAYDGTDLRWWNGTTWTTVTVT